MEGPFSGELKAFAAIKLIQENAATKRPAENANEGSAVKKIKLGSVY
jgi:hypothetical protein